MLNEQFFHIFPLAVMIINCLSTNWVVWSGTINIDEIIPMKLNMYWGLYQVDLQTNLLGKGRFSMTIPDFVEFATNQLGLEVLTATTLPLYYSIYILYIVCIIYQCYNLSIAIYNYNHQVDRGFIKRYSLLQMCIARTVLSVFLVWCLFKYYGTEALCINNFIGKHSNGGGGGGGSGSGSEIALRDIISEIDILQADQVCSYSWSAITIIGNEGVLFLYSLYIYRLYCKRVRIGGDGEDVDGEDRENTHNDGNSTSANIGIGNNNIEVETKGLYTSISMGSLNGVNGRESLLGGGGPLL